MKLEGKKRREKEIVRREKRKTLELADFLSPLFLSSFFFI